MEMSLEKKAIDQWRLERKFPFANHQLSIANTAIQISPGLFSKLYEPRWVHNIYFDSIHLKSFHENLNGISERAKTRIRWYSYENRPNSEPHLEIKIKNNSIGNKKIFDLNADLHQYFQSTININNKMIIGIKGIKELHLTGHYEPILHNYYFREYFISFDKKIRLTLDSQLTYENLNSSKIKPLKLISDFSVIELKYNLEDNSHILPISNQLPFRMDKFSKYIEGIKILKIN